MLDTISQIGIFVLGVSSIILVGRKNRWGFALALLAAPFWFYTAYAHGQWGVFLANFAYTASWLYGFYQWFFKNGSTYHSTPRVSDSMSSPQERK